MGKRRLDAIWSAGKISTIALAFTVISDAQLAVPAPPSDRFWPGAALRDEQLSAKRVCSCTFTSIGVM